jgi:hypothetical protein
MEILGSFILNMKKKFSTFFYKKDGVSSAQELGGEERHRTATSHALRQLPASFNSTSRDSTSRRYYGLSSRSPHITSTLMDSSNSCILSLPRMATLAQATKVIFGQHGQLGIWLIGLDSGLYMCFPSLQYWHSTFVRLWFFFPLGMTRQRGHSKRGIAWHSTYDRMENRNRDMRQHFGDSVGSSSSLYSTGPVGLPPWHSPWSCPVEWFDLQGNSLGFAPGPIPIDPSSSTPSARPPVPPPHLSPLLRLPTLL